MRSLLAAALTVALAGSASATVIFSDNFNAQNGGAGQLNFNAFSGWTVSNGSVDLIGAGTGFDFYPGNGLYVDLDGSTGNAGDLTANMPFAAGTYQLSFSLGGNARGGANDQVTVSLGSWSEVFNVPSNFPFTTITRTFTTTGGQLKFSHAGGDNIGAILDNVSVSTVPEPVSLLVFGGLLVGGIAAVRRRMAKA
jgi:hypothetical protein